MPRPVILRTVMAGCLVLLLATWARTGPFMQPRADVDPQRASLADLKRFGLKITLLAPVLEKIGLSRDELRSKWVDKLTEQGFVLDDDAESFLELKVGLTAHRKVPDAVAINPVLSLWQPVTVGRTRHELVLPTYTISLVGLERKEHFGPTLTQVVDGMLDQFVKACESASASP